MRLHVRIGIEVDGDKIEKGSATARIYGDNGKEVEHTVELSTMPVMVRQLLEAMGNGLPVDWHASAVVGSLCSGACHGARRAAEGWSSEVAHDSAEDFLSDLDRIMTRELADQDNAKGKVH